MALLRALPGLRAWAQRGVTLRPCTSLPTPLACLSSPRQPVPTRTGGRRLVHRHAALLSAGGPQSIATVAAHKQQDEHDEATATAATTQASGEDAAGKPTLAGVQRLVEMVRPDLGRLGAATVLLFLSSGVTMSVPFGIGTIIDTIASHPEPKARLAEVAAVLVGAFGVGAVANFGRIYLVQTTGQRVVARLRKEVFGKLLHHDTAYFDRRNTGEIINRLSADTVVVGNALSDNVSAGMRSVATALLGTGMMLYMSPQLTAMVLGVVPPVMLGAVFYGRYVKRLSTRVQDALADANHVAEERIGNIRTVKAFAAERQEEGLYAARVDTAYELARTEAIARGLFYGSAGLAGNIIILTVLWQGGSLLLQGELTIGYLTSFLMYSAYTGSSVMGISSFYSDGMKGLGASRRLLEVLDEEPRIRSRGDLVIPPDEFKGRLEFQGIEFGYERGKGLPVLAGVDLDVPAGSSVALVGASGCGKSTLASLMLRLYDPSHGRILLDGRDTRELDWRWYRRQVGYVSQEPTLFSGTIRDNLAYASPGADMADLRRAAEAANAAGFIEAFPDGYDTVVGERGITLSGGQRQRVAIARAILTNPRILLLDEATSALDVESEHLVIQALRRIASDRTVVLVAHRESTIRSADRIAVLHDGRVAEHGTFTELLQRGGRFADLLKNRRGAAELLEPER